MLYMFWSGCEVYFVNLIRKFEEIRCVMLVIMDCFRVIVEIIYEENEWSEGMELLKVDEVVSK